MRIDEDGLIFEDLDTMTCQVYLADLVCRDRVDVIGCLEAVVLGADIDVIDIEKYPAAAPSRHGGQELPFRDGGVFELHVTGDILDQDLPAQEILDLGDALCHMIERLLRVRQREQVVEVISAGCAPAQVLRDEARLEPFDQLAELRSRIATILSEVETSSSGELQQRYEQAELALENAAAAAMTAATEDTLADTARIEASGVYQDLGDMHLSAGRGLSEQLLLLQRLAAFVDGADDDGGSTIKELTTARDEALVQARAAYSDAKSQLEMVSATGRAALRLESLRAALDELLAAIE